MLANDYYLANFRTLVSFVGKTYQQLLCENERQWLSAIESTDEPAQRLYIRLLGRKGPTFRLSKLRYAEIADVAKAVDQLKLLGLVKTCPPVLLAELAPLFTKTELIRCLALDDIKTVLRSRIITRLLERDSPHDVTLLQMADQWVTVQGVEIFKVYSLCFFGNQYQSLAEFVLRDLGVQRYEPYQIDYSSRVFHSRIQIDAHLTFIECSEQLDVIDLADVKSILALEKQLPNIDQFDSNLRRRVDRLRNRLARQLERLHCLTDALVLYQRTTRPPSRERQVRVLMALGRYTEAIKLCEAMESTPLCDAESQFVELCRPRLARACGHPVATAHRYKPDTTRLTLKPGLAKVELMARDFYSRFGECFYVENSLVTGVLGLFIWDVIYLPIKGVFFNPFQSAPADFYEADFLTQRQFAIQQRMRELDDPRRFAARVWSHYESRYSTINPLVRWERMEKSMLTLALIRIPPEQWRALFDRLLSDLRYNASGLPDLVLFPDKGGYEFLEIKGPGDVLQKNQRRWMEYFAKHGIAYRVVQVCWAQE